MCGNSIGGGRTLGGGKPRRPFAQKTLFGKSVSEPSAVLQLSGGSSGGALCRMDSDSRICS